MCQNPILKILARDPESLDLRCGSGTIILRQTLTNPMAGKMGVQSAVLDDTRAMRMGNGGSNISTFAFVLLVVVIFMVLNRLWLWLRGASSCW